MVDIHPGQDWIKLKRYRLAQVSGYDARYAYMYWPDKDTQTRVQRKRLGVTTEWRPV